MIKRLREVYCHWPTDISAQKPWFPGFDVARHPHNRATSKYVLSKIKITNSDFPPQTSLGKVLLQPPIIIPCCWKKRSNFRNKLITFINTIDYAFAGGINAGTAVPAAAMEIAQLVTPSSRLIICQAQGGRVFPYCAFYTNRVSQNLQTEVKPGLTAPPLMHHPTRSTGKQAE